MKGDLFDNRPKVKTHRLNILPANPEESDSSKAVDLGRFPSWLHRKLPKGGNILATGRIIDENRLHTVCEEAKCPNLLECWSNKTATFLVMGKSCTRNCGFCDIDFTKDPVPLDTEEPYRVADSVKKLGLKHVVITMVARDDLSDGGAAHLAAVVNEVRKTVSGVTIEVLASDLEANFSAIDIVLSAKPEIYNHNIETVRELTPKVRHKATYDKSLSVLEYVKKHGTGLYVKSGLMVGLGETESQVIQTMKDLRSVGCDILTIGQYLQANRHKLRVKAFINPDQFKAYEEIGYSLGFKYVYSGPFVRSSYNAGVVMKEVVINSR